MIKKTYLFLFSLFISFSTISQNVGINTTTPHNTALLELYSTDQGLLMPRMTSVQRDAIVNPAEGLIIYNTTTQCFNFYRTTQWYEICGNCIAPPVPVISDNSPVCEGDTLKLFASTVAGANYSWIGPGGFTSFQQNPVIPSANTSNSGTYQLTVSSTGCTSTPVSLVSVVNPAPSADFTFNPDPADVNQNCNFSASTSGLSYNWSFQSGSPSSSTSQNPTVQWSGAGTYNVSLTVDNSGCTASNDTTIDVINCPPGSMTFNYTGAVQTWTVPSCVSEIDVDARGAQGGGSFGGLGGRCQATIPVTPGETLYIYVGGQPTTQSGVGSGGWNGGGDLLALPCGGSSDGWPGGGASDVRRTTALSGRLIVAGGGGGTGWSSGVGGAGGGLNGGDGDDSWVTNSLGHGASQFSGGAGGTHTSGTAPSGTLGNGGNGGPTSSYCIGGGGGGGYYGGGGGYVSAGGGGSSYYDYPGNTNKSTTSGFQSGNGTIVISW